MRRRPSIKVRQIPTRTRLMRVFLRHYLLHGHVHSGCIRFEQLHERFGTAVRSVIESLIEDGLVQQRNCGALAYELTLSERIRLGRLQKQGAPFEDKKLLLRTPELDLDDLGPQPTLEARCAARNGVSITVYRLQNELRELPIIPTSSEMQKKREHISRELVRAARLANCVAKINLMAGIAPGEHV